MLIMKSKIIIGVLAAMLILSILVIAFPVKTTAQAVPKGPYLDEVTFFEEGDEAKMLKMIERGEAQIWLWPVRTPEGLKYAEESPDIELIPAYAGDFNLFLNPVDTLPYTGEFNIFSIREVREAMNWLINREFVVREIMGGFGIPHWTVFPPVRPDYIRLYPQMKALEAKYAYNPDKAVETISDALVKAGAKFIAGKWYYQDKPIKVRVVIRIEDQRKDIGEYVAGELERLGLEVERIYSPASKAIPLVYGGDPRKGEWHVYTEGWAFTAIAAYDDDLPYFMYVSPWTGAVFEYYTPAPPFPDLAQRLLNAEYKSAEERNEWVLRLAELALKDSTRVWVVWEISPFPRNKNFVNVAYDLTGGAYSLYSLRSARYEGKIGGSAKAGNRRMLTSAWNPVGGFTWLYDALIERLIYDPGVWTHPHTGEYIPIRSEFSVTTAGPEGKLPVPEDAIIFDPATLTWKTVGPGVEATSAVTFTLNFGPWHHGPEMTLADVMNAIAETYRITYEEDPLYDPASITPGMEVFVSSVKGFKIEGPNKITVYIDYWHIDPTFIAAQASVWTGTPWEVYAIMNAAVENKELAFSDTRAEEWGVEWLDLSKGPSLDVLKKYYDQLAAENFIPSYIKQWVSDEEARARWSALGDWYNRYGHFLVSNGPFFLYKVDPAAKLVTVRAFRNYVYTADHWDYLVTPRVPDIEVSPLPEIVPGQALDVEVFATLAGEPYNEVDIDVLVMLKGQTVLEKKAELVEPGRFVAHLSEIDTAKLAPEVYDVTVIAIGHEAALAKVATVPLTVVPTVAHFEERFKEIESRIGELSSGLSDLSSSVDQRFKDLSASIEERFGAVSEEFKVLGETLSGAISDLGDTMTRSIDKLSTTMTNTLTGISNTLTGALGDVEKSITGRVGDVESAVGDVKSAVSDLSDSVSELRDSVEALSSTVTTVLYLVVVAIILSLISIGVAVWAGRRR